MSHNKILLVRGIVGLVIGVFVFTVFDALTSTQYTATGKFFAAALAGAITETVYLGCAFCARYNASHPLASQTSDTKLLQLRDVGLSFGTLIYHEVQNAKLTFFGSI